MIQLIEAPPRSGKSYFAVNYLCKFTTYDALYNEYVLDASTLIISNIEGLRINHWKLDECLKKQKLQEFFSIANFESIMEKTGKTRVIICIDEVHEIFPIGFKDQEIYNFFAYHGHIGLDIILMTQSLDATTRMFNPLLEFIVKVRPRSRSVLNNFSYTFVTVKGTFLYSKSIPKKKLVFGAYKSFRKDEHAKPKSAVKHWLIVVVVLLVGAGFLFKTALSIIHSKSEAGKKHANVVQDRLKGKPSPEVPQSLIHPSTVGPGAQPSVPGVAPAAAPVFSSSSSAKSAPGPLVSPAAKGLDATVTGFIDAGGGRRIYLLSDARMVNSSRRVAIGDGWYKQSPTR